MNGQFELNVYVPLMARNLLQSIRLLASASRLLAEKCVEGIEANREQCRALRRADARRRDRAQPAHRLRPGRRRSSSRPPRRAARCARSRARPGVEESVLDEALDYRAMAKPHGRLSGRPARAESAIPHGGGIPMRFVAARLPRPPTAVIDERVAVRADAGEAGGEPAGAARAHAARCTPFPRRSCAP